MKRFVGWLAVALGVGSLLFQAWVVVGQAEVRAQAIALDFPLTSLGEGLMIMLVPMVATALSALLGVISFRIRAGRIGLVAAACNCLAIWLIVGREGFHFLF